MQKLILAFLATLVLPSAQAQPDFPATDTLSRVLDVQPMAWWGVMIADAATGEILYQHNPDRSFMPASVTKLFTTAAALEQLGPDFRYETRLYLDGTLREGLLEGDLIVRGAGDPSIGTPGPDHMALFDTWADSLAALGVKQIRGNIIGDDQIFDDPPLGADWGWDDLVYGYAAPISGLTFHENVVELTLQPTSIGSPGAMALSPMAGTLHRFVNRSETVAAGTRLREKYTRSLYDTAMIVETQVPMGRTEREFISVTHPTLFFAEVFRQHLAARGIPVHGAARDLDDFADGYVYDSLLVVARHISEPLADLAAVTNKDSNNLYAEHLLRTLGVHRPVPEAASADMGHKAALRTFAAAGLDTLRLQLADGSGLSRRNLVSPRMALALLQYMAAHPDADVRQAFSASLAVGGVDGTLEYRFPAGTAAYGKVRAKTGTIGNVSALAGYVESAGGRQYAFAIFCNHFIAPYDVIRGIQDRVVNHIARL
ncbi:MAG: D-alanyl-D-alanine carboxypeptidase/D-alanyl-D-alanine-endopeptidase [Bacteroidota bacterium]|nr:D-alanyl-D-alanine carboxypeptidase/D-alanyl-D-alanine-endopeptidase [Bacteroidota bacterium]MDE2833254.1 D-alanyl-D-alanine carboxypeptidase/D-alanyl-D-alanine-endopeptidase [Bacteroidota bacterium]